MVNRETSSLKAAGTKTARQHLQVSSRLINRGFAKIIQLRRPFTFLTDKIRGNMDKGLIMGAAFIDLKKAFDTVPHDGLLNKLYRYGIQDQPLSWFESYLTNRTQGVSIENHLLLPPT